MLYLLGELSENSLLANNEGILNYMGKILVEANFGEENTVHCSMYTYTLNINIA